jgi:hypothetical protein
MRLPAKALLVIQGGGHKQKTLSTRLVKQEHSRNIPVNLKG